MGKSKQGSGGDYGVGKFRPPIGTRFKPGQSGNPAGRPVKRRLGDVIDRLDPTAAMIIAQDNKHVERRREDGSVESLSRREAVLEAMFVKAMKGDIRAMEHYLRITNAAHASARKIHFEMLGGAVDYIEYWLPLFQAAARKRADPPRAFPHPEDVLIHEDGSVEVVGPATYADHLRMLEVEKVRDLVLSMLDSAWSEDEEGETNGDFARRLKVLCQLNRALPPRLRKEWHQRQ